MTDDHVFIDTSENILCGKKKVLEAWKGIFDSFPDYRNILENVTFKDDTVTLIGRSTCSDERLDGPAVWTAKMRANQVAEWRVYDHIVEPP